MSTTATQRNNGREASLAFGLYVEGQRRELRYFDALAGLLLSTPLWLIPFGRQAVLYGLGLGVVLGVVVYFNGRGRRKTVAREESALEDSRNGEYLAHWLYERDYEWKFAAEIAGYNPDVGTFPLGYPMYALFCVALCVLGVWIPNEIFFEFSSPWALTRIGSLVCFAIVTVKITGWMGVHIVQPTIEARKRALKGKIDCLITKKGAFVFEAFQEWGTDAHRIQEVRVDRSDSPSVLIVSVASRLPTRGFEVLDWQFPIPMDGEEEAEAVREELEKLVQVAEPIR